MTAKHNRRPVRQSDHEVRVLVGRRAPDIKIQLRGLRRIGRGGQYHSTHWSDLDTLNIGVFGDRAATQRHRAISRLGRTPVHVDGAGTVAVAVNSDHVFWGVLWQISTHPRGVWYRAEIDIGHVDRLPGRDL